MNKIDFSLDILDVANWCNVIRTTDNRDRLLDALYYGQLASKAWIINNIRSYTKDKSSIFIFGGWVGILANMLFKSLNSIDIIYNIDIDNWALDISKKINPNKNYYTSNDDIVMFKYPSSNNIIAINTIAEHLNQDQYLQWYQNVPLHSLVVVQGNNLFQFNDHVRCSNNLEEFLIQNDVSNPIYAGELEFAKYKRFMAIWRKNELH